MATIGSMAGVGMQAIGAFGEAKQNRAAANATALLADARAKDSLERGEEAIGDHRRRVAQLKATQTVNLAARGLDTTTGSPLDILLSTEAVASEEASRLASNAYRESQGEAQLAANYRTAAKASNPWLAGGATLLGSAGKVAEKWYVYRDLHGRKS